MILLVTINPAVDYTVRGGPFEVHRTNRGGPAEAHPGGKGNNAARVAHRLGAVVSASGLLGGSAGAWIERELASEGIRTEFVPVAGQTRFTLTFVEHDGGRDTKVVPSSEPVAPEEYRRFLEHFGRLIGPSRYSAVAICGSMAQGVPATCYAELIEIARRADVPVLLDSSGAGLAAGVAARPWCVKPNVDEARELCGCGDDTVVEELARAVRERFGAIVALSAGERGAVFATGDGIWWARPPRVTVVNAVGAGDAFVGGLLSAWDCGNGRFGDDVMKWAVAAGTCSAHRGWLRWTRAECERMVSEVTIERMA